MRIVTLLLTAALLLTGGCALLPDPIDETKDWSADRLYSEAKEAMNENDYEKAVRYFELIEARYPFGRYAQQAQLDVIYAYYKFEEPASAIAAADRFIQLHPRHPSVAYAYYMKGLAHFTEGRLGPLERYMPKDETQRDPGGAREAFQDFSVLLERFPDSEYAEDARQRMVYLRNNLAWYELHVADWYLRRGAYVAAANRARNVIEQYQGTPAMPDALTTLARSYRLMGMDDLAADALRVLEYNYPDHPRPASE